MTGWIRAIHLLSHARCCLNILVTVHPRHTIICLIPMNLLQPITVILKSWIKGQTRPLPGELFGQCCTALLVVTQNNNNKNTHECIENTWFWRQGCSDCRWSHVSSHQRLNYYLCTLAQNKSIFQPFSSKSYCNTAIYWMKRGVSGLFSRWVVKFLTLVLLDFSQCEQHTVKLLWGAGGWSAQILPSRKRRHHGRMNE